MLDFPSNVVQKKRVARILFFKIKPSQEILKIRDGTPLEMPSQEILKLRDGTPLEAEKILTYIKALEMDQQSQEILKIRDGTPFEAEEILTYIKEIIKIRDGTPLEAGEILTYIKSPRNGSPSQEILKIRDGTPLEAEEILTYIKSPRNGSVCYFSSKLDILSNVIQKKRVARILFFKIRQSQEILKIRDGTPLEAEEILTYIKALEIDCKSDVPSNIVQKKRVAWILFFKIRQSQEILKIRDGTPFEAEEILTYIKGPRNRSFFYFSSKLDVPKIIKIRDGTPLEAGEILTYIKSPRNGSKRVARILFFKLKPSQEILKIRDGTPLEAEEILTYIKSPRNGSVCYFSSKLDILSNVIQKKRVARILFFKIRQSQEILKIRDGTPLEAEEILTYIKALEIDCNVVQKNRVARILFFKIRPSQEILKLRDGTPLEAEKILTYIKALEMDQFVTFLASQMQSQEILKIRDGTPFAAEEILTYIKEIIKIRDGTPLEAGEILTYIKSPRNGSKRVARILFFKLKPSQEILKIRDGTPLEAEEILTYIKSPRNGSVCYFSSKLDILSNVIQKKRVARILFFKIRQSQEILKIRDGTPLEAEEILTYIKALEIDCKLDFPSNVVQKKRVARILFFKIKPSQEILKIRDGTPLEAEEILTYIKRPSKRIVARILFFKIRPSQEILKLRDGTPLEAEKILTYIKALEMDQFVTFLASQMQSQEILKIRDGTPFAAEEILTYIKGPRNRSFFYFSSKLDVPSNVVQKKKLHGFCFSKLCHLKKL
ncbi:hypothetical protein OROMI_006511 [Orobanche minor]